MGRSLVVSLVVVLLAASHRQTPNVATVGADEVLSHLQQGVPPVYPPIAVAARVEGTVTLTVLISPAGQVEDAQRLRSIPLLDQAAIDAVKQWRFAPFAAGGQPAQAVAEISIPFYLDPGTARLAREVAGRARDCRALLATGRYDESETVCAEMANMASKLPSLDRADAYHLAGQMLAARGLHAKAAEAFTAEIRLLYESHADRIASACQSLGAAQAANGDLKNARRQYDKAEKAAREYHKEIARIIDYVHQGPIVAGVLRDRAAALLRSVLTDYVEVLHKAGLDKDAAAVRARLDTERTK